VDAVNAVVQMLMNMADPPDGKLIGALLNPHRQALLKFADAMLAEGSHKPSGD